MDQPIPIRVKQHIKTDKHDSVQDIWSGIRPLGCVGSQIILICLICSFYQILNRRISPTNEILGWTLITMIALATVTFCIVVHCRVYCVRLSCVIRICVYFVTIITKYISVLHCACELNALQCEKWCQMAATYFARVNIVVNYRHCVHSEHALDWKLNKLWSKYALHILYSLLYTADVYRAYQLCLCELAIDLLSYNAATSK